MRIDIFDSQFTEMKIRKLKNGYELVTNDGRLYVIDGEAKFKGKVSDNYKGSGALVKGIPNHIKKIAFELNKKP